MKPIPVLVITCAMSCLTVSCVAVSPIPLLVFVCPQPCSLYCVMLPCRVIALSCSGWEVVGWCWLDLDFEVRFCFKFDVHVNVMWTLNKRQTNFISTCISFPAATTTSHHRRHRTPPKNEHPGPCLFSGFGPSPAITTTTLLPRKQVYALVFEGSCSLPPPPPPSSVENEHMHLFSSCHHHHHPQK